MILEGVVPLLVDGAEVDVAVISTWVPSPSTAAPLAGMAAGLLTVVVAALTRARLRTLALLLLATALPAAVLGIVAVLSVPPETGPSWTLWVPPLIAVVLGLTATAGRLAGPLDRWSAAAGLIGSLTLVIWGYVHQEWMWRAVLPTVAPFWLERAVTAAALAGGVGLVALIGRMQARG